MKLMRWTEFGTATRIAAVVLVGAAFTVAAKPPGGGGGEGGSGESGENGERRRPPVPPIIKVLDADKDGVISAEEIAAASAALLTLDKDGDGQLTPAETRPPRKPRRDGEGGEGEGRGKGRGEGRGGSGGGAEAEDVG